MANVEREHQILSEPPTQELLEARQNDGWHAVAIVWERQGSDEVAAGRTPVERQAVPFGLKVAPDCQQLETDSTEREAMKLMLRLLVDDVPFAQVAAKLNEQGFCRRRGGDWNQTAVFHMLPRLLEIAPAMYSSSDWIALRPSLRQAV